MTLEEIKEAVEIIKAYRQRLTDSVSTLLDGDIKAFDIAIEAMERESCDAISRQAVFDALEKVAGLFPWRVPGKLDTYDSYNGTWNDAIGRAEMEIEGLPPVNPQKTGHWKSFTHSAYHGIDDDREPIWREVKVYHCNLCNRRTVIKENYCPNCGARMVEPQERSGEV